MARRFARRRKPRVAWLPVFGDQLGGEPGEFTATIGIRFGCLAGAGQPIISYDSVPVTWDAGTSPAAAQGFGASEHSLSDFVQGESYRLRRIVGKFFCEPWITTNPTNVSVVQVAFGFIVRKVTESGSLSGSSATVNPLYQDSANDPWIWRRSWLLKTSAAWATTTPWSALPQSNTGYHSVADGPHIDQKTARIIGPEERLIATMAARAYQTNDDGEPTGLISIGGFLDYRLLASMRSNIGNRGNASR